MRFSYTPYLVFFTLLTVLFSQNLKAQLIPYYYPYDQDSLLQSAELANNPVAKLKANSFAALHCLGLADCDDEQSVQLLELARAEKDNVPDSILTWLKITEAFMGFHSVDLSVAEKRDSVLAIFEVASAEAVRYKNTAIFRWAMYGMRFTYINHDMVEADIGVLQKYSAHFGDWNKVSVLEQIQVYFDMGLGFREISLSDKSSEYFYKCYQLGKDSSSYEAYLYSLKALMEYSTLEADTSLMLAAIKGIEVLMTPEISPQFKWEYTAYLSRLYAFTGQITQSKKYLDITRALRSEVEYPDLKYARIIQALFDAEILNLLGEYAETETIVNRSLADIDTSTFLAQTIRLYEYLMVAQAKQGKYKAQSQNFQTYDRLQKRRTELQFQQKLLNSEREYKTQLRLQKIARLEQEKLLLARQRLFIGIGFAATILLLGLVFLLLRQARKRNHLLSIEKQTVETQSLKLKEIEQSKNNFFINIAHELRTPLTLIKGPVKHLLRQKNLAQGASKLLQIVATQSENMHELLDQLLYLDRPQKQETTYNFQRFQIKGFLDALLPSFYALAEMQQIRFELDTDDFSAYCIDIDQGKLQTILKNLLANAFKFTPKGGTVKLSVRQGQKSLQISVQDTGRGIPAQSLPYIFERFYQVPTEQQEGGSGIGLAICKRYVDSLRGTISAESKLGEGTLFKLDIPVDWFAYGGEFMALDPEETNLPTPRFSKVAMESELPLILVVEDQGAMSEYLRIILEKEYQVQLAANGKEALSFLERGNLPQLIISDIMMPEMDGKALVQALRKNQVWRSIPIIILTARNESREKLAFLRIGVDDYLVKPFIEDELLARLDNLIDNYQERQAYKKVETISLPESAAKKENDYDTLWVEKLVKVLQPMLSDVDLTLDKVADQMAVSVTHLHRKVKTLTGMTAMQFIQDQRFEEAKRQLEKDGSISIKAVSYSVGFKSEKNFSRNFRKRYGVLPSVYRAS